MHIQIEKNVPVKKPFIDYSFVEDRTRENSLLVTTRSKKGFYKMIFDIMDVKDSFCVATQTYDQNKTMFTRLSNAVYMMNARNDHNMRFVVRTVETGVRVWRIA